MTIHYNINKIIYKYVYNIKAFLLIKPEYSKHVFLKINCLILES